MTDSMKKTRISLDNIPSNIGDSELRSLFMCYGSVQGINRESEKIFVDYSDESEAKHAVESLAKYEKYYSCLPIRAIFPVPDSLLIFNFHEEDIPTFKDFFAERCHECSFMPTENQRGFSGLAFALFSSQIDVEAIITELRSVKFSSRNIFYKVVQNITGEQKVLQEAAQKLEKRMLFMHTLCSQDVREKQVIEAFSRFGKIDFYDMICKNEKLIISIVMETKEAAAQAMLELNFSLLEGTLIPIAITPFLFKHLSHPLSGLIVINELEPSFSTRELFKQYSRYGTLHAMSVCPVAGNLVAFLLYQTYEEAMYASKKCKQKNVFLFPPINSVTAVELFPQQKLNPNLTVVTFGHQDSIADPILKQMIDHDSLADSFFTIKHNGEKIAVTKYLSFKLMKKALVGLRCRYEIIGTSTFRKVFDLFPSLYIPSEWEHRVFYAYGISNSMSNSQLRAAFSKVAPVKAAIQLCRQRSALILFSEVVETNNQKLLSIMPNPVFLQDIKSNAQSKSEISLSQGEINATFLPNVFIISEVGKIDPSKKKYAKSILDGMTSDEQLELALEPNLLYPFLQRVFNE